MARMGLRKARAFVLSRASIGFLILAIIPSASHAADVGVRADFEPPDTAGWHRAGFLTFKPAFALRDVGRDTNVFLVRSNPESDYTATMSPGVSSAVRFGTRGFLTLNLGADHVWFSKFSNLNHTNYMTSLKGNLNLRELRFFAAGGYIKVKERPNNEIDERAKRDNTIGRIGVGYEYSPMTALDYILTSERIVYSDPDFRYRPSSCPDDDGDGTLDCAEYQIGDLLSRTETTQTLRFSHRVLGRTRLVFDAQRRRYDFHSGLPALDGNGDLPPVGSVRDARESRLLAGFETDPGSFLSGSVRAGVVDLVPKVLTDQRTRFLVFKANLVWRLGSRISLSTAADRDLYFSTFANNLYYREDHSGVQCVYYLNRVLGVEAGYDGYRLEHPVVTVVAGFEGRREDRIGITRVGFRFRLANRTTATLRVASRRRTSNIPDSRDDQVLVTTGVETTF